MSAEAAFSVNFKPELTESVGLVLSFSKKSITEIPEKGKKVFDQEKYIGHCAVWQNYLLCRREIGGGGRSDGQKTGC